MLILTGNGRPHPRRRAARDPLGQAGRHRLAGQRPPRPPGDPVYVELVLWESQAQAAAEHLVKGQAVAFTGRLEPRSYETSTGERRVALEVHGVDLEYGAKPRSADTGDARAA